MDVQELADQLFEAEEALDEFTRDHVDVLQAYMELQDQVAGIQDMLKTAAKEAAEGYGEHEMANTGTHKLVVTIRRGNRKINAAKLLEAKPQLAEWEGLLAVRTTEFDKAVSAGIITKDFAFEITSHEADHKSASFVPVDS